MTLEEAIEHCYEKAEELRTQADYYDHCEEEGMREAEDCLECAKEHEQLAGWLTELQQWQILKLVCAFDGYVVYKETDNDKTN